MRLVAALCTLAWCTPYDAEYDDGPYAMEQERASVAIVHNEDTGETDTEDLRYVMHRLGRRLPARNYYLEADRALGDGVSAWHFDAGGSWVLSYCPSGSRMNRIMFRAALQNAAEYRPPLMLQPSTYPDDAQ